MKSNIFYIILLLSVFSLLSCKKKKKEKQEETKERLIEKKKHISISKVEIAKELLILKNDSLSKIKNKDSVIAFYKLHKGEAAWRSINNRKILLTAISNSKKHGLNPSDYNENKIKAIVNSDSLNLLNNTKIDLFLTDNYLSYAYHLANGKINSKDLYDDWKLNSNIYNFNSILNQSLNENSLQKSFEEFVPKNIIYSYLKKQLPIYKTKITQDSSRTILITGLKIKPMGSNDRIINIRKRLNELGFLKDTLVNSSKVLDSTLQISIQKFQGSKKLKTDAIIGDETINALNETYQDKYNSILANLERFRWFPRKLGNDYISVNIADYNLQHITKKDTSSYNVIVGKSSRKTPVFTSQVNYLEFNPKWYIPPTIKKEDIIPAAKKDINYLRNKKISVFYKGEKLILDSINWSSNDPIKYSYVQSAGNSNALGRVKIIFPNDFSVYLHDTSSKYLFNKIYKARSSGCVRVQNVFSLAGDILKKTEKEITDIIETDTTKRIHVNNIINVHFLYWTVTFNEKNKPIFINDVYKLDNELAEKLTYKL